MKTLYKVATIGQSQPHWCIVCLPLQRMLPIYTLNHLGESRQLFAESGCLTRLKSTNIKSSPRKWMHALKLSMTTLLISLTMTPSCADIQCCPETYVNWQTRPLGVWKLSSPSWTISQTRKSEVYYHPYMWLAALSGWRNLVEISILCWRRCMYMSTHMWNILGWKVSRRQMPLSLHISKGDVTCSIRNCTDNVHWK